MLIVCPTVIYSQSFQGDLKSDTTKFYLSKDGAIAAIRTAEQLRISKFELTQTKKLVDIYRNQRDSSALSSFIIKRELLQEKLRNEALTHRFKSANTERWIWRGVFLTSVTLTIKHLIQN